MRGIWGDMAIENLMANNADIKPALNKMVSIAAAMKSETDPKLATLETANQ